jgi:hypothetical protein
MKMIGLILGILGAFVGLVTGLAGAAMGVLLALGGVVLGLAVPFAPLLVLLGVLVFLVSGQKCAKHAPQGPER